MQEIILKDELSSLPPDIKQLMLKDFSLIDAKPLFCVSKFWQGNLPKYVSQQVNDEIRKVKEAVTLWNLELERIQPMKTHLQRLAKREALLKNLNKALFPSKFLLSNKSTSPFKLFKKSIKKGDFEMVHCLFKTKQIPINTLTKVLSTATPEHKGQSGNNLYNYVSHNPFSFIWHCHSKVAHSINHYELVKLLLMHGNDPLCSNAERLYFCSGVTKSFKKQTPIPVKDYALTERRDPISQRILSLIYLGCAESCFRKKSVDYDEAKKYLQQSHYFNKEVFDEYAKEVMSNKQGFALLYDEDQKTIFTDILKGYGCGYSIL